MRRRLALVFVFVISNAALACERDRIEQERGEPAEHSESGEPCEPGDHRESSKRSEPRERSTGSSAGARGIEEQVETRDRAGEAPRTKASRDPERDRDGGAERASERAPPERNGGEVVVKGSRPPSGGLLATPTPSFGGAAPSSIVPPIPSPGAGSGVLGARTGSLLPAPALSIPSGVTAPVLGGVPPAPPFSMSFGGGSSLGPR